jgi:hypothetical protein
VDHTPGPPEEPIPSTETQVTSEDFLPTSSEATGRSEFFKAMAFEADRRVKELEQKQATLEARVEAATTKVTVLEEALNVIAKRAAMWVDQHWAADPLTSDAVAAMLAILGAAKGVLFK